MQTFDLGPIPLIQLAPNRGTATLAAVLGTGPAGPAGADGARGADGAAGPRGEQGPATITPGTATTGAPGSSVIITNSGTSTDVILDITIPRGDVGAAATVDSGTTTTGDPGTPAAVTNSGTSAAAVFDFTIPQGIQGIPGTNGTDAYPIYVAPQGTVDPSSLPNNALLFEYAP